jgi:membrane-bound serine protease (ClpP class)
VIAADVPELLRKIDGRTVALPQGHEARLALAGAPVVAVDPGWRGRVLAVLSDPSIALVLMMIGLYGLVFEFANPGFVVPGVVGGLCLLLGLFALQMLPINYAGLALVLLGIVFFIAEAFVPSYGALGIGGVAALAFGALLLIDSDVPGFAIPRALIASLALCSAMFVIAVATMAARARRRRVVSGAAALVGAVGELIEADGAEGYALLAGERWHVRMPRDLNVGQRVRVARVDGLTLEVVANNQGG